MKLFRKELFDKIWEKPITHVAKNYGVSDSAIIKVCKKMEIPRPLAGHWAKIKAGRVIKKPTLPKLSKTGLDEYNLIGMPVKNGLLNKAETVTHPLIKYELDAANIVTVEDNLAQDDRHKLYVRNVKSYNNAKLSDNQHLEPRAKTHFDLSVTSLTVDRALLIMDALVKAFDKRGWSFKCVSDPKLRMITTILDEEIEFCISEKLKRIDHVLTESEIMDKKIHRYYWGPKWDYISSGTLSLKITNGTWLINRSSWNDGKVQRIEDVLNKFCISAIELSEAIKVDREKKRLDTIRREEERVQRERLRVLREAEIKRREIFDKQSEAWNKAEELRRYINAVSNLEAEKFTIDDVDNSKSDWLGWANNYADHMDPLKVADKTIIEETEHMFRSYW